MVVTFKLSSGAKWVSVTLYETYITERRREGGGSEGVTGSKEQREKGFRDYYKIVVFKYVWN